VHFDGTPPFVLYTFLYGEFDPALVAADYEQKLAFFRTIVIDYFEMFSRYAFGACILPFSRYIGFASFTL